MEPLRQARVYGTDHRSFENRQPVIWQVLALSSARARVIIPRNNKESMADACNTDRRIVPEAFRWFCHERTNHRSSNLSKPSHWW